METHLADFVRDTRAGQEAENILRQCVHCGFCTATCPTYQLLGDELDGPRGRIYLIKQMLEGAPVSDKTRLHLDRCLTCRACESTCPSGVRYSRLLDIGREFLAERLPARRGIKAVTRYVLRQLLPRPALFGPAMKLGQAVRPILPAVLQGKVPPAQASGQWPTAQHSRRVLALAGCAQPSMLPNINAAAARLLDRLGISVIEAEKAGCCGAVRFHLDDVAGAQDDARRNINAWWPHIESGAEAILMTASGCGVHVKDYGHLLAEDATYAGKAQRVAALTRDASELIAAESAGLQTLLAAARPWPTPVPIAFHSPCTLQHGQQIRGVVERLLASAGFVLHTVADSHFCCGSAGTYSILQAEIAGKLRANKLAALMAGQPVAIASANIGCIAHLQEISPVPVRHWLELLDERLG